jgi:DNA (cytosine-5)-methyltransferase 1
MPTFGSLFAGIGGIDLGLERAGWTGRWQVEWDDYCTRVLAKHWPDVPRYGDIRDVHGAAFCPLLADADIRSDGGIGSVTGDGGEVPTQEPLGLVRGGDASGDRGCPGCLEPVDLIAGGFPCQPVSFAGRRAIQDDDRWLWPEFARCIRELRPRYVLVENVPGLLVGGGMDEVLGGLADLGYDAEWESIPAAAVGAPHLRYRVWIIAYRQGDASRPDADGGRSHRAAINEFIEAELRNEQVGRTEPLGSPLANADLEGSQGHGRLDRERDGAGEWPPRALGGSLDGWWLTEPDVGRVAHGVPARVDRLRSLGNSVVPQVVEWIGRRILEAEVAKEPHDA